MIWLVDFQVLCGMSSVVCVLIPHTTWLLWKTKGQGRVQLGGGQEGALHTTLKVAMKSPEKSLWKLERCKQLSPNFQREQLEYSYKDSRKKDYLEAFQSVFIPGDGKYTDHPGKWYFSGHG